MGRKVVTSKGPAVTPSARVGIMEDPAAWDVPETRDAFLSQQLRSQRLVFVLGAGASFGFGLPSWEQLVYDLAKAAGVVVKKSWSAEKCADRVYATAGSDEIKFAELVRRALYGNFDSSIDRLLKNDVLRAVGAASMASVRGSANTIVSFNYDDLLEEYLRHHGVVVQSVARVPAWRDRCDVQVLHPHGLLPNDMGSPVLAGVVLAQEHYDRVVGKAKDLWRATLISAFASHTCVFVGLSGDDKNLRSILEDVKDIHVSKERRDAYWGVRTCGPGDENQDMWSGKRVFNIALKSFKDLGPWLIGLSQGAAKGIR